MESNTSLDSSSERFIPLRGTSFESFKFAQKYPRPASLSCLDYVRKFNKNDSEVNFMQNYYKKNQYKDLVAKTLFQSPRRVLYFSPEQKARKHNYENATDQDWPVKSRKKPLITTPDLICDVPNISSTDWIRQRVDMGATNKIAYVDKDSSIGIYDLNNNITCRTIIQEAALGDCVKWNTEGNRLAFTVDGIVKIWDMQQEKVLKTTTGNQDGIVGYIAYTKSWLITATTKGFVSVWTHDLEMISTCLAHKGVIISAKVSCNEKYLVTNGLDCNIKIWTLPTLIKILVIRMRNPVSSLEWHPWKEPILIAGKTTNSSFCSLFNINRPSYEKLLEKKGILDDVLVDCVTFNPISAELVVGLWFDTPESKCSSSIIVQNNLHTVVDDVCLHKGRTLYLMWDKEGKKLATVGADENFALWNFFGREKKKQITPIRREPGFLTNCVLR